MIPTCTFALRASVLLAFSLSVQSACKPPAQPEASAVAHAASQPQSQSQPPPHPQPWFAEEAEARGISFLHESGHDGKTFLIPESVAGGVALFDMDADNDLDVYLVQSGFIDIDEPQTVTNRLFRNRGDGRFDDVTANSGANISTYGIGVTTGDYDNDADVDLYVTSLGPNVLLQNDGRGRFTDVTQSAGVHNPGFSSGAAFFDYDRDGDLDLIVLSYLNWSQALRRHCADPQGLPDYCKPTSYNAPASATLYANNGNGTFTDVSEQSGIAAVAGTGLGVVCGDFNADNWPDIFVANDAMPNRLWINQHNGTFIDHAPMLGCALDLEGRAKAGMGVCAIDYDDDGDLDVLVCNLMRESDSFYRNEGGRFVDATASLGVTSISRAFTRFGAAFVDFNNDAQLDLFQANGRVSRTAQRFSNDPYAEPNLLFRGVGDGKLAEVQPRGGTEPILIAASRGAAFGDIDNDGGVDILIANRDGPVHLLHNIAPQRGNWIMFRVLDQHGRDAFGAIVTLKLGNRTITREVRTAYSYAAANDPRIHVGLGDATQVDDVTITWPDGTIQSHGNHQANQIIVLKRQ